MEYRHIILAAVVFILGFFFGKLPLATSSYANGPKPEAKLSLNECLVGFDKTALITRKTGWAHWFIPKSLSGGLNLKMSYVEANDAPHPPHIHAEDEIFYLLEGKAEFILGAESRITGPSTAFYCPGGVLHGIRNAGDVSIRYLVIKD